MNSNDDEGVLIGKWDGQYQDGTAPNAWTGSVIIDILLFRNEFKIYLSTG